MIACLFQNESNNAGVYVSNCIVLSRERTYSSHKELGINLSSQASEAY